VKNGTFCVELLSILSEKIGLRFTPTFGHTVVSLFFPRLKERQLAAKQKA